MTNYANTRQILLYIQVEVHTPYIIRKISETFCSCDLPVPAEPHSKSLSLLRPAPQPLSSHFHRDPLIFFRPGDLPESQINITRSTHFGTTSEATATACCHALADGPSSHSCCCIILWSVPWFGRPTLYF